MKIRKRDLQLIAITDRASLQYNMSLHDAVEEALMGGVSMVLLDESNLGYEALMREAVRLKILCGMYDIPFAVRSNADIADAVDADGIELTADDISIAEARNKLGRDRFIGFTVRNAEEAVRAEESGAQFLMCGPVKVMDINSRDVNVSVDELKKICACVHIPVTAYGGIADVDISELKGTGICGIGCAMGIFGQNDVRQAARSLRDIADEII